MHVFQLWKVFVLWQFISSLFFTMFSSWNSYELDISPTRLTLYISFLTIFPPLSFCSLWGISSTLSSNQSFEVKVIILSIINFKKSFLSFSKLFWILLFSGSNILFLRWDKKNLWIFLFSVAFCFYLVLFFFFGSFCLITKASLEHLMILHWVFIYVSK